MTEGHDRQHKFSAPELITRNVYQKHGSVMHTRHIKNGTGNTASDDIKKTLVYHSKVTQKISKLVLY